MRISVSLAVLAVVGGLSGCASNSGSQKATTEAGLSTPAIDTSAPDTSNAVSDGMGAGRPIGGGTEGRGAAAGERPDLRRSVYYEFDKYDVKPEYRALVESHSRWLRANPRARLTIEGNTDEIGSREYNVALGQRRAESVTALMVLLGVKPDQIEAISFGKEKPRAVGPGEAAWAENRRSDFAER